MKDILKACEAILPTNHVRIAINHILVNKEEIVATDDVFLLVYPHGQQIDEPCVIINKKAKTQIKPDCFVFEENLPASAEWAKEYLNYKRVLPKDRDIIAYKDGDNTSLVDVLYDLTMEQGIMFDYIERAVKLKKLSKLLGNVKKVNYSTEKGPVDVHFFNGTRLLLMPYCKE